MNKESKRNNYFQSFIEDHIMTKEASEEKPDDKLMESEEFKENFAENYKEITENEEEAHKEELKADGFYENAVDEAFNKAIEETKAEIRPITTEVEDILDGKCASEAVSGLYKEAARRMDKEMLALIKDWRTKDAALKAGRKAMKGQSQPNMVELTKLKQEAATAKQKMDDMARFYETHGLPLPGSKADKIENALTGTKGKKGAVGKKLKAPNTKREVRDMKFTHSQGVKDANGERTGGVERVTDKVKRVVYTGDEYNHMNRRSQDLRRNVVEQELRSKKPTKREKYNPSMASPGNTGAVNVTYKTKKDGTVVAKNAKKMTATPNPVRVNAGDSDFAKPKKNFAKRALPIAGAGAGIGMGAYQVGKRRGQNQNQDYAYSYDMPAMGALASEVSAMFEKTASVEPTLTEKVSYVMDGGMEKEAFLPAALVRGGLAAVKGISRGIKAAGGLKNMNMGAIGNAFKRGGSAFKNSFTHDAGAQNAIKAGNWIKNNPKKSMAIGGVGTFGVGTLAGAKQNPNGMQETLASEVSAMFEKTAKKVPFPNAKSLRKTADYLKKVK